MDNQALIDRVTREVMVALKNPTTAPAAEVGSTCNVESGLDCLEWGSA